MNGLISGRRRRRSSSFRIIGWLAVISMLGLALLGPAASSVLALTGAVYTSNSDGSIIDANHYDAKADVYLTGGPCNGGSHPPAGGYYFERGQPAGGGDPLSTDAISDPKVTLAAKWVISSSTRT